MEGGGARARAAARAATRPSRSHTRCLTLLPPTPPSEARRSLHGGLVPVDPVTPDVAQACSKRAFDGQVRKWRRMLHAWDPVGEEGGEGGDAPAAAALSPGGTKRTASARTPASAGRRKQGRTGGADGEAAAAGGGGGGLGVFEDGCVVVGAARAAGDA